MNIYTLRNVNDENSFLDIFNDSSYIVRYTGVYFVGGFGSRFCTDPIFPSNHLRTTFPDDANMVEAIVQRWIAPDEMWRNLGIIAKRLPEGYCYRCSGTSISPQFQAIPCPDNCR